MNRLPFAAFALLLGSTSAGAFDAPMWALPVPDHEVGSMGRSHHRLALVPETIEDSSSSSLQDDGQPFSRQVVPAEGPRTMSYPRPQRRPVDGHLNSGDYYEGAVRPN